MAVHANGRGRDAGVLRSRRFVVAIEAVDPFVADVMPMIERDRLVHGAVLPGDVRSPDPEDHGDRSGDRDGAAGDEGHAK
jgi:hypothetical protein